ncbi:MAG: uroporphyrinogen decarboxylase [Sphingobacteriales bacterium]|nr:MAG: uroporphyrinogen decarboxylase [Sphingobacteriales bacterium]
MINDILLRTVRGEHTERKPVWLMRQAGRILPQYRRLSEQAGSFLTMVKTPEIACEVTLQPVDELEVDAAIIYSDILVIPEAMGLPYQMEKNKGPVFSNTIKSRIDVDSLQIADEEGVKYTIEAIRLVKSAIKNKLPLIGFAGAPWTIFAYMVEGSGSKTFSLAKKMLYTEPQLSHLLLDKITKSTINYLQAQVKAGADLIQIFDSWAGILSPQQYTEFALPYISQICNAIENTPVTIFAKGAFYALYQISGLSCDVIGLDWTISPIFARQQTGTQITLQGNLDPCVLYANQDTIRNETLKMLNQFGSKRHIVNLGHGVYPDTPLDGVKCFIDTVKNFRCIENN